MHKALTAIKLYCAAIATCLFLLTPRAGKAQTYVAPLSGCIEQYYDSHMYGWLALRNTCSVTIHVQYLSVNSRASNAISGSMELRPDQSKSTGYDRQGTNSAGGLEFYVCPIGYDAVDAQGNYLTHHVDEFKCKAE